MLRHSFVHAALGAVLAVIIIGPQPHAAHAELRDSIEAELRAFDADTRAYMERVPPKTTNGAVDIPAIGDASFKYDLINEEADRLERGRSRHAGPPRPSGPDADASRPAELTDRAEDLVDRFEYARLDAIERAGLTASRLDAHPWSGTYWPIAKGVIAWRYADPKYPASYNWKKNSDYLVDPANACSVGQLSPAEKYDLLAGDTGNTLRAAMLKEGAQYYHSFGSVESWMGICHGWAPASYMSPRPTRVVKALAADGRTQIPFYPSDLKALESLLWANGRFENRFIGARCYHKQPATDENGRITDESCNGTNAGTWHLSVVNQIGASRRSFVMDANHDTEIWNQPVYGYRYAYFNPQTKKPASSLGEAAVAMRDFMADKFAKYRSDRAASVVGIAMELTYVSENSPSTDPTDSPETDAQVTVHYLYDLELDARGAIIGGEWYSTAHPGFLWTPVVGAEARSDGDELVDGGWDGSSALPASWLGPLKASARLGQPLAHVVGALEALSALE
jgi:hypothetical protein